MQLLSLVNWLLRRRLRHSWLLLAVTSFGILASVTIMSTGALYSRALGEAGLRHTLGSISADVLDVQITAQNRPLVRADYLPLQSLFQEASNDRLGPLLRSTERFGRTQSNLSLLHTPTSSILGSPSGRPYFLTGFEEHTRLIQGRWPDDGEPSEPGDIETVIGAGTSRALGFGVGDRMFLVPVRGSSERIAFEVVGVAEPIDPLEEYWMGGPVYFEVISVGESVVAPLFLTENDFFQGVGARYPTLVGDFGFFLYLDSGYLTAGNADEIKQQISGLETDLNKEYPRTLVLSRLERTVDDFNRALTLAKVPLYLYLSLVVAVVLYFLALITGTLGRSQAEEAGLLRSRGASLIQVSGVLAMAEGIVALAAMIVGPFLAWAIVKFLLLSTINPSGEFSDPIPLGLAGDMFWMGALGGVMALVVLLTTAVGRAKMGTLEALLSRARPPTVPFLHRYYLDILAVLAVALIWYQIRGRDGFVAQELAQQGLAVDPTLILGPVMGLLAAAVLLLRLLPLVVRVLAWAGTRVGAAWFQFSLLRLARDPIPHGSLAVILMLAAALGVFGATFQSSLSQGQSDQARYRVGGDVVLSGASIRAGDAERLRTVLGVTAVSLMLRDSVTLLDGPVGEPVALLAVEPRALAEAAWFREDFSSESLQEISRLLRPRPSQADLTGTGIPLPEDTVSLGVWVDSSGLDELNVRSDVNMWARLMTATGSYRTISMGNILERGGSASVGSQLDAGRYRLFTGELPAGAAPGSRPFELVAVFFTTSPTSRLSNGVLYLDDITAFGPSSGSEGVVPEGVLIEGFEGQAPWTPLANQGAIPDLVQRTAGSARTGGAGLEFSWQVGFTAGHRGIHLPPGPFPIPAIGGPGF
ncbi:MAG: FtsX-like permease family protein, partial [Dehalococcoidia bacterium]